MYRLALLGHEIGYSLSPKVHAAIASAVGEELSFEIADVARGGLENEVKRLLSVCDGFFVTKPYKTEIAGYLSDRAADAVNVVRSCDKRGFNTDGFGFIRALDRNFGQWRSDVKSALVLGAGGGARAVIRELIKLGKRVYVIDRTPVRAYKLCTEFGCELYSNQPAELIVNCTPLGTYGEDVLKALCILPEFKYAYDLVYVSNDTPFLRRIKSCGGMTVNGADMLIYQAIEGDNIIFGGNIDADKIFDEVKKYMESAK